MFYTSNLFSLKLIQTALFNYKSASHFSNLNPGSIHVTYIEGLSLRRSTSGEGHSLFFFWCACCGFVVVVLVFCGLVGLFCLFFCGFLCKLY